MVNSKDLQSIPSTCGVYIFYAAATPLYVGKAVNLKARLISHVRNSQLDSKEAQIISQSERVEYKTTMTEFDALLLEASLIRKYQPKYNVSWKDDKSYLYIKINKKELYPKPVLVRRENDHVSIYYGPFTSARVARLLLSEVRKAIPFCTQKKVTTRRCFYAKINLCDPCPNYIEYLKKNNKQEQAKQYLAVYKQNIRRLLILLNGRSDIVLETLQSNLQHCIAEGKYEEAIAYRNKLFHLKNLLHIQITDNADSLNRQYLVEEVVREQIGSFLRDFFGVAKIKTEYRVECFDISNLFGREATGSMVVFRNSQSDKSQYRRYKIRSVREISDIFMLAEVLRRRFGNSKLPSPDLVIVDGGRPQLQAAEKVFAELNLSYPLISIAKRPDRVLAGPKPYETISLRQRKDLFKVIQAVRDESHRFARKYHLYLRRKKIAV